MKLPNIEQSNQNINNEKKAQSLIKQKYKIISEENEEPKLDSFSNKMKEVKEIRIYLKENLSKNEIDNTFMKDIEKEYAEQFLLKMKLFPTKNMIQKVLKLCPLKYCDFELNNEYVYFNNAEKIAKVIHIYPIFDRKHNYKTIHNVTSIKDRTNTINNMSRNARTIESTEDDIKFKKNNSKDSRNLKTTFNFISTEADQKIKPFLGTEENFKFKKGLSHIRKKNYSINTNTGFLYNKEYIEDMLLKNRENVVNMQLFNNKKSMIKIDLSPENIKEKYISSESNWSTQTIENKGKLSRISKSILTSKNLLNNKKYFFDLKDLDDLSREIMEEVNEPINIQIELIIKDINYILDNFPMEEFIQAKNQDNLKINLKKDFINKITINNRKDLIKIMKIISSNDSCRIIALSLNLIYWTIFGGNSHIQVDSNTKEYLYLKIMKEWENIENKFINKNLFYKVYTPLFIIICRIEIENILTRKYINLFKEEKNKLEIIKKANAIISEIFDKHGYMNSFNLLCGNQTEFNKKFHPNYLPRYKNKLYATSNFVELLFRNEYDTMGGCDSLRNIKEKKSFIMKHKVDYFNFYLNKMNNNLKKRNLEPIFKIKKTSNDDDKNQFKSLLKRRELNMSRINKMENNENMKITDYMETIKQDYIRKSSFNKNIRITNNNI